MPTTDSERSPTLRGLPSVDQIMRLPALQNVQRPVLVRQARVWLEELRTRVLDGTLDAKALAAQSQPEAMTALLRQRCATAVRPRHERVYNATGIVLHTGIGRAPLPAAAVTALSQAGGYAVVEVDPTTGVRDQRELGVAALLKSVTGAEGALVVNNNAAAVTLMLAALCAQREVVISRGELVEIGGGFRVPDVMRRAGCTMVEVGATNKTHLRDFADATTEQTVAYLKVHPSNFRIEGFAGTPSVQELVELGAKRNLLVLDDLGSGLLWNEPIAGLADEPRVRDSLQAGAHVTCFSGDKLLGGPQCGILVGRADLISRCRAHPLYRALRCDKLTLAALEATLLIYRDDEPLRSVPTLRLLSATSDELRARSEQLLGLLPGHRAHVVESDSFAGSGANPARALPSFAVALPGGDAENDALRAARPISVFARVMEGRVLLDARTLLLEDQAAVAAAVQRALA
ncbi:MAG TPA: L-seryl-tRNA(Sec) selenium transferase [Planctomycetota bacterium]|nr:L-seryl-tRNA(Sec) selenium transferase [Planctomycetota bacterium]